MIKYFFLIATFYAMPYISHSQHLFVRPHIGHGKTELYNAEDKSPITKVFIMQNTMASNIGLAIGYHFNAVPKLQIAISSGINYMPIHQNYYGKTVFTGAIQYINTHIEQKKLQYLQIPLLVEFNVLPTKRISPLIGFGGFINYLSAYKDNMEFKRENQLLNIVSSTYNIYQNNKVSLSAFIPGTFREFQINEWIFKKQIIGWFVSIGLQYKLNKKIVCAMNAVYQTSSNDVENKKVLNFTNTNNTQNSYSVNVYDLYYKTLSRDPGELPRPITTLRSTSITISFQYSFQKLSFKK
jgi:hypothetical protein